MASRSISIQSTHRDVKTSYVVVTVIYANLRSIPGIESTNHLNIRTWLKRLRTHTSQLNRATTSNAILQRCLNSDVGCASTYICVLGRSRTFHHILQAAKERGNSQKASSHYSELRLSTTAVKWSEGHYRGPRRVRSLAKGSVNSNLENLKDSGNEIHFIFATS